MHADIVKSYRYVTAEQVARLMGDESQKHQNTRKVLARLAEKGEVWVLAHGTKNVYCPPGSNGIFLEHDLLVTDAHLALRDHVSDWRQVGLRDGINPDAFFVTEASPFFLELENANPKNKLTAKALEYARHADARKHLPLCPNFRVLFIVPTARKAANLERQLAESGIPNLGRFWIGHHAQIPRLATAELRCPSPKCKLEWHTLSRTTDVPLPCAP